MNDVVAVVPIATAVKAMYLMPVTVTFGVCFAIGLDRARSWRPAALPLIAAELALLGAISVAVFWHGLLFDARAIRGYFPMIEASEANLYGVVYAAARDRGAARQHFQEAAAGGLYLGYENLALLAFDERRPGEALHLLKRALRLQPAQSFGRAADRSAYDRITRAEYLNLTAVFSHALERQERAWRAAGAALRLDPAIPEIHYDLAVVTLEGALGGGDPSARVAELLRARRYLERALALDAGFIEAAELLAVAGFFEYGCPGGARDAGAPTRRKHPARLYPVLNRPGAPHAASIGRRRHITDLPASLHAEAVRRGCSREAVTPSAQTLPSPVTCGPESLA